MQRRSHLFPQQGTSMIEVLVTLVILMFGLLGLVGLQSRLQVADMEAYQRAQALILLDDMANRISTNRSAAASYLTSSPLGTGAAACTVSNTATRQAQDSCEWSEALKGAAELSGNDKVGALIGGRGCVESPSSNQYMITVAWQGMGPAGEPPSSVACGLGEYNSGGTSNCTNDRCRRVVTTLVRIN